MNKISWPQALKEILLITAGILSATIGLKGLLLPNGFYDGGAMGIALVLSHFIDIELSLLIIAINIPFVLIGTKQVSISFAIKSAIAILILSVSVHYFNIPVITQDKLLIAIFGGVFLGLGIGLTMRGGAVIDGTEVLAIQISRQSSLSVGDFIGIFNFLLFACVAYFINIETAMYSMLTYVSAAKAVDFIVSGIEEYIGVTIISQKPDQIRNLLTNELRRAVTVYKLESGYANSQPSEVDRKALYCVTTRLEVTKLLSHVSQLDSGAFVIQHAIKDTRGGMIKKRPLH
jgi:uncharacterized membrane-anchored protein YitT (DUF2179 family)